MLLVFLILFLLNAVSYAWQPIANNLCCWCVKLERSNVRHTRITTICQEIANWFNIQMDRRRYRLMELERIEREKKRNAVQDFLRLGAQYEKGKKKDLDNPDIDRAV